MRYIVHLFDGQVLAMTFLLLGGVTILVCAMYGLFVELTIFITKVRLTATNYYPTMGTDPDYRIRASIARANAGKQNRLFSFYQI